MAGWNPWHGCRKYSDGCKNCYVYRIDARHDKDASIIHKNTDFDLPIKRKRTGEYKISSGEFVYTCFSSDFFLQEADEWRPDAWQMIKERSDLHFLFITKRIVRFYDVIPSDWGDGYKNVTICCTVENQKEADIRLPLYMNVPIARKEIICEPLLGPIDLSPYLNDEIKGVTVGGESGLEARECNYEWVLSIREQCAAAGIPFHFKQTGYRFRKNGTLYKIDRKFQSSQAKKANIDLR